MLPDYPIQKQKLMQLLIQRMRRIVHGQGLLAEVPQPIISEGTSQQITRGDQSVDDTEFERAAGTFHIQDEELDTLTPVDIIERVDKAAQQMHDQISRIMFKAVDEATRKSGNVLKAEGPVTPQRIMEMLDMLEIDFRSDGEFNYKIVCGPEMYQHMQSAFAEIESNPDLQTQFDKILAKKRKEWNACEATRKLVG